MTIGSATAFIRRGIKDTGFRRRLNATKTLAELSSILAEESLVFSANEFEDAWYHELTLCQDESFAVILQEFKLWWELLFHMTAPGECNSGCSGCHA